MMNEQFVTRRLLMGAVGWMVVSPAQNGNNGMKARGDADGTKLSLGCQQPH